MCEIKHAGHAKNQREPDGQHGINGASDSAVDKNLHYFIQGGRMKLPVRSSLG